MPLVGYNREMVDTLHFFVYNTHNLFMYNFSSHSYRSYVVNIKIPANFMSVENEEGRIFIICKGADSIIEKRLAPDQQYLNKTKSFLDDFAKTGLRTLLVARKEIT